MTNTLKLKNKKGFTLTELIVVIVIIGILAAVLIPSLTGYISKAKTSAAEQEAQVIADTYEIWYIEQSSKTGYKTADTADAKFVEYINGASGSKSELGLIQTGATFSAKTETETTSAYNFIYKATNGVDVKLVVSNNRCSIKK